jgi:CRISPR-associated protein Cas2
MLMIVAYDVRDARRLARVARHCEDYGVRVQYSVFECRLPAAHFEQFWQELTDLIEPAEDRLVAYRICASCARDIRTAGTMTSGAGSDSFVAYVF